MTEHERRIVVTSAPPNPNGDLHLGHLSGPFLGADVATRYLRQRGHRVVHVGYSDDYSCYVTRRAAELGLGPSETAYLFGQRIQQTLALANLSHDYFTHPLREPLHAQTVQQFFTRLWETGKFEVQQLPVLWCPACDRYLYEAEMRGRCQFCDAPADGFYCEECGRPQDTDGLAGPVCTACQTTPVRREMQRITFPLEKYRQALRDFYQGRQMRPRLRSFLDDMLSRPLSDTTVSRVSGYGVPVPLAGWEGHILDTWFSGIWGYMAAARAHADATGSADGMAAWQEPGSQIYEFIGFDCSFSHAILWPALFLAHGELNLPEQIITNEFYQLEGGKFSTSRGHAIWGSEFLRRVPADQLRFYLCLTGPERAQTNFSATHFRDTVNRLLTSDLQRWLDRVLACLARDFGGVVPDAEPDEGSEAGKWARELPAAVAAALEPAGFSPHLATSTLAEVIDYAAGATRGLARHRVGTPGAYAAEVVAHTELAARFAAVAAPIMPAFAEQVWSALGLEFTDPVRRTLPWPGDGPLIRPGQRIAASVPRMFLAVAG